MSSVDNIYVSRRSAGAMNQRPARAPMSAPLPCSEVSRLDSELVRLGRGTSAVRLSLGSTLDALSSSAGHHELGFSSLEAYARERCERTGRWAADTRALARNLE